jgi:hypothetical protein
LTGRTRPRGVLYRESGFSEVPQFAAPQKIAFFDGGESG